jgi:hypothetical protein
MKETPTLHQLGALVSSQISPQEIPQDAWPGIIGAALHHGLAPMLLWVVKQSAPTIVAEPLWRPIITTTRGTGIQYIALEAARKQVTAALDTAQISPLWLKGIALAHTSYPQPVLRSMSDLDVLVPYEQRESALKVVEELGYHFFETGSHLMSPREVLGLSLTHHYHLKGGLHDSIVLEVHFRLLSADNELLSLDKLKWFWTQTRPVQNGTLFTVPTPEAHLLYLCAHAILQHGEEDTLLRQYFDLHQLVTTTTFNWDQVTEQTAVLGWEYAVARALSIAVRYFATPVPEAVSTALQSHRRKHDAVADRAIRIRSRGSRWEQVWMSLHSLSFPEQVAMVRRILFPPKSYMRSRYSLRDGRWVWPAYLYRWFDQSREIAWAIGSRVISALRND